MNYHHFRPHDDNREVLCFTAVLYPLLCLPAL